MFYRKYRPQKIEELDNETVRSRLSFIVAKKSIPHAFLFAGSYGTGKTSAARIVAKIVNCEADVKREADVNRKKNITDLKQIMPCNKCDLCKAITNGTCVDVLEIDAASNRGIDEIRDLREKIKLAPALAIKKVYIIDEAHMLTIEAFNALLKTLEEPPEHAIFILCTTNAEKLPKTIISRCLRINFRKANLEEIVRSLQRIVKAENLKISKKSLMMIGQKAGGSFRDATKTLEQILSAGDLSDGAVEKFLKIDKEGSVRELVDLILRKQAKESLLWIDDWFKNGGEVKGLTRLILENLREKIIADGLAGKEQNKDLLKLMELILKAADWQRQSPIEQLPLEMAVIEWIGGD